MDLTAENNVGRTAANGEPVNKPMVGVSIICRATLGGPHADMLHHAWRKRKDPAWEIRAVVLEYCVRTSDLLDLMHKTVHNAGEMEYGGVRQCSQQARDTTPLNEVFSVIHLACRHFAKVHYKYVRLRCETQI